MGGGGEGIMRVLAESGARQNYNLGDVIPVWRNGLHIPSREGGGGNDGEGGLNMGENRVGRSR